MAATPVYRDTAQTIACWNSQSASALYLCGGLHILHVKTRQQGCPARRWCAGAIASVVSDKADPTVDGGYAFRIR
jgi:hypothetical protein